MSTHPISEPDYTIRMPGSVRWSDLNIDPVLATHDEILANAPTIHGDYKWIRFTNFLPSNPYSSLKNKSLSLRQIVQNRCTQWNSAYRSGKVTTSVSAENLDRSLQQRLHLVYTDILRRKGAIDLRAINFDDTPGLFLSSKSWEKLVYNMGSPGQDGLNHPDVSSYEVNKKYEFLHLNVDNNSSTLAHAPTRMQISKVFLAGVEDTQRKEPFAIVECYHSAGDDHSHEPRYAFLGVGQIVCSKSLDTLLCRQRYEALGFLIDKSL